jgi:molybdopterin biosynthesis enzyme
VRAFLATRAGLEPATIDGAVLCHDLRAPDGALRYRKGRVLRADDLADVTELAWDELHLVRIEAGDVHEDEAGERLARAAAGPGVRVGAASAGHWPLHADWRGIADVATTSLEQVNGVEGLCVYTLFAGHVVDAGEVVARAKITPFVMRGSAIGAAESLAYAAGGLVSVRPFIPMRVAAVVQEALAAQALERFERALCEKVRWFGSTLSTPCVAEPDAQAIADAIEEQLAGGAQLVVVAGSKAMDELDPTFRALDALGARRERHGVPAHPGSLFWLARLREVPIVGLPTCGLFSQATVFDLVLPRVLVGDRVDARTLATLGHGGLLTRDVSYRFPPYRPSRQRGALDAAEDDA